MEALKGTCDKCGKVYFWTDFKTGLGKTPEQLEAMHYRQTHCKFCKAEGLKVEIDVETEAGKAYDECNRHAAEMIAGLLGKMLGEHEGNVGVRMAKGETIKCADKCPRCGCGPLDGATGTHIDDAEKVLQKVNKPILPKPGDVTVCVYCNELLLYTEDGDKLGLRAPTKEEEEELLADTNVQFVVNAARHTKTKLNEGL